MEPEQSDRLTDALQVQRDTFCLAFYRLKLKSLFTNHLHMQLAAYWLDFIAIAKVFLGKINSCWRQTQSLLCPPPLKSLFSLFVSLPQLLNLIKLQTAL